VPESGPMLKPRLLDVVSEVGALVTGVAEC
jgi:hypothetical protein